MTITLTWTDAQGVVTPLTQANGIVVMRGALGLGAPSPQNSLESYVAFDGSALVSRRRDVKPVTLPLYVRHATRAQTLIGQLASMFQGPGELQYSDGTNTRKLRKVIYDAGLAGDLSGAASKTWRRVAISLLALDPWWYDTATSALLPASVSPTSFDAAISFDAASPFDGGNSATTVVTGDTEAYPVITITGPVTTLAVTCGGVAWALTAALPAGSVLVVDTRPGSRGPRLNGGSVDWSLLTAASRLWTLPKGTTSVIVGATGATGATTISMAWEPRFLTP